VRSEASAVRDAGHDIDRELVREIATGSADALGLLYDRHAGVAFALARRIVAQPEAAEEVVQDVFAQVWREAGRYERDRASVAGWIVMLTRTRAIDHLRARRARPDLAQGVELVTVPVLAATARDPEQTSISTEEAALVRKALDELPENQRSLIGLAYYEGLTHTEIAGRTGVPLGTVKTRLRAAMMALRQHLQQGARGTA
jgi:RNA polymerase sigma-70 factor (ECF subfamily)